MTDPVKPQTKTTHRKRPSLLKAVEAIEIPISGSRLRGYRTWNSRRGALGLAVWEATRFADSWLPSVVQEWVEQACPLGWEPSSRSAWGSDRCRNDPRIVAHVAASDGWQVHLCIKRAGRSLIVHGERCWKSAPDSSWQVTWTDDDRLSVEELRAGVACRGCGRPFSGGPEWVPLLQESPDQRTAREAEDLAFGALHPDCHAGRWTLGGGGIQHCQRCCAPPPVAEETLAKVARIFVGVAARQNELAARWNAAEVQPARPRATPSERTTTPPRDLGALRRAAAAAGYELVPKTARHRQGDTT
jgi:hypothetical protein